MKRLFIVVMVLLGIGLATDATYACCRSSTKVKSKTVIRQARRQRVILVQAAPSVVVQREVIRAPAPVVVPAPQAVIQQAPPVIVQQAPQVQIQQAPPVVVQQQAPLVVQQPPLVFQQQPLLIQQSPLLVQQPLVVQQVPLALLVVPRVRLGLFAGLRLRASVGASVGVGGY